MPITPSDNSKLEYEDLKEELLEYKLEEIISDWINDFGEIPKEKLEEINDKITNPNLKRIDALEDVVRTYRRELNSKNLEFIAMMVDEYEHSTVDFSDIMIDVKDLEKQLSKQLNIDELNALYKDELQHLKYILSARANIVGNKKRTMMLSIVCAIIIATFFYFLGKYT